MCSLSDCYLTRTQDHLVCQRAVNYLAKLTKSLSCVLSTYLYSAFDCMFLSCDVRILSDCNWSRTQNHLLRKRTLIHLAKLNK